MKSRLFRFITCILSLSVLLISIPVYADDPVYFTISEEILPMKKGTTYQLQVTYDKEDTKNHITWYTTDASVATVSSDGIITAIGNGEVIIFAEYNNDFIMSDGCKVTVMDSVNRAWGQIDGTWYLYSGTNFLTGWQYVNSKWYYLASNGMMTTGWQKVNEKWYYMSNSGSMMTGWQLIDGDWYLFSPSGAMLFGWQKPGTTWYYLGPKGTMLTGWQKINGNWYYMNSSGAMLTGWQKPGSIWYYLKDSGQMVTETYTINGYQQVFHTNGAWISTSGMDTKAQAYSSNTNYLVLVSLSDKVTKIYKKSGSSWAVEQAYLCTVGDPSKGWDTITGTFYIGQSSWGNPTWKGYSFNDSDNHTLYYWTRFCDSFLFHSILYKNGTWNEIAYGNELGKELSHGCVRLRWYNAKWIYDNVPYGTKVVVY